MQFLVMQATEDRIVCTTHETQAGNRQSDAIEMMCITIVLRIKFRLICHSCFIDPTPQTEHHPHAVSNGHSSATFKFAPPSRSSFSSDYPMDQSEIDDDDDNLDHEEEHDKFSTASIP